MGKEITLKRSRGAAQVLEVKDEVCRERLGPSVECHLATGSIGLSPDVFERLGKDVDCAQGVDKARGDFVSGSVDGRGKSAAGRVDLAGTERGAGAREGSNDNVEGPCHAKVALAMGPSGQVGARRCLTVGRHSARWGNDALMEANVDDDAVAERHEDGSPSAPTDAEFEGGQHTEGLRCLQLGIIEHCQARVRALFIQHASSCLCIRLGADAIPPWQWRRRLLLVAGADGIDGIEEHIGHLRCRQVAQKGDLIECGAICWQLGEKGGQEASPRLRTWLETVLWRKGAAQRRRPRFR